MITDLSLDPERHREVGYSKKRRNHRKKRARNFVLGPPRLPVANKLPSLEKAQQATYLSCPDAIAVTFPVF